MMMRRLSGDRGSLSILAVVLIPGLLMIIGLAVDGGAKVQATQRANAVADEAARAGGQALDRGEALGGGVTLDVAAAVSAAQAYLVAADVSGAVAVVDGDTLLVTTTVTQDTVLLDLVGINTMTVTGSSTADLVQD